MRAPLLLGCLLLAACGPAPIDAAEFSCPASVTIAQTVQGAPLTWQSVTPPITARLERVAFYLMDPKLGGSLVPDSTTRQNNEERVRWTFPRNAKDQFWLGCVYAKTEVLLTQPLATSIATCEVRYTVGAEGTRSAPQAITCK